MYKFIYLSIIGMFCLAPVVTFAEGDFTPTESIKILETIRAKNSHFYSDYSGIKYDRKLTLKTFDPSENILESISTVHVIIKRYFYKESETKVISYTIDDENQDPADYDPRDYLPAYHLLDQEGMSHYDAIVEGYSNIDGINCYKIKVTPQKSTKRHESGYYFVDTSTLSVKKIEITLSELPFPLRKFKKVAMMANSDGFFYTNSYSVDMILKVPILYHKRMVVEAQTLSASFISK